jgi:MFS transporter, PPP family, 3-phenylpropionic acid transporter
LNQPLNDQQSSRSAASLFASYFFYVGVFSPYLALFFSARGFSVQEIGFLMALTSFLRILGPWLWAHWADHSSHPERLLKIAAVCLMPLVFSLAFLQGLALYAAAMILIFFVSSAFGPISESFAMRASAGNSGSYSRIRVFGSIGFLVGVLATGPILDLFGVLSLPWWMAGAIAILIAVCWRIPQWGSAEHIDSPALNNLMRQPAIALFFFSGFLMVFSHVSLYTFYSLYLEQLGFSKTTIGLLWSTAVVAEIILFYFQGALTAKFSAQRVLLFCFVVAVLRFALISQVGDHMVFLALAQLLHAITFALHHSASMAVIHERFAPNQWARAQALNIIISYGFGGTLGGLILAKVWEVWTPNAVFSAAAFAAALGLVAMAMSSQLTRASQP